MKLTTGARTALLLAAAVVSLALVLDAKYEALPLFVAHRSLASLACFALFLGLLAAAARLLRASGLQFASVAAPFLVVLLVDVIVSPLPYEMEHEAERLPHPEGALGPPLVDVSGRFEMGHPIAVAIFRYPGNASLARLTNATLDAYAARGWTLAGESRPTGEGPQDYAVVTLRQGPLRSGCTLGTRTDLAASRGLAERTLTCTLTLA